MGEGEPKQHRRLNLYATPKSGVAAAEVRLADDEPYRVIDGVMYCRSPLDLRDICWLTGATEGLVGTQKRVPRAAPKWLPRFFLVALSAIFAFNFTPFLGGAPTGKWMVMIYPLMLSNWLLHYLFGEKEPVQVGQSVAAKSKSEAAKAFGRCILFYVLVLALVTSVLSWTTARAGQWVVIIGVNLGVVVGLVCYIRNRPRDFTVTAAIHSDGVFRLRGLTPEFLHAAMQKQSW
jgi:hypothetical protein